MKLLWYIAIVAGMAIYFTMDPTPVTGPQVCGICGGGAPG